MDVCQVQTKETKGYILRLLFIYLFQFRGDQCVVVKTVYNSDEKSLFNLLATEFQSLLLL